MGDIPFTVDASVAKHGRFMPGSRLPILPISQLSESRPDFILVLPWDLAEEIISENRYVAAWGARFAIPLPRLTVVDPSPRGAAGGSSE